MEHSRRVWDEYFYKDGEHWLSIFINFFFLIFKIMIMKILKNGSTIVYIFVRGSNFPTPTPNVIELSQNSHSSAVISMYPRSRVQKFEFFHSQLLLLFFLKSLTPKCCWTLSFEKLFQAYFTLFFSWKVKLTFNSKHSYWLKILFRNLELFWFSNLYRPVLGLFWNTGGKKDEGTWAYGFESFVLEAWPLLYIFIIFFTNVKWILYFK